MIINVTNTATGDLIDNSVEDEAMIGPLIDLNVLAKLEEHMKDAISKGGKFISGVTKDMLAFRQEASGLRAPMFKFKTEGEAIEMANDTEFGWAASFCGQNIGRIWRNAETLEYEIVGIDEGSISTEVTPFGGGNESGLSPEESKHGIEDYLDIKYHCMRGIEAD